MRKALIVLLAVLLYAVPASAQESGRERRANFFVAPGVIMDYDATATLHLGGGTETVWPSGVGFGIDAGYLTVAEHFEGGVFFKY